MWFCVMTSLIQHKEPLSWIYCIVKSWPQGFGREMSCSQVPEIFKAVYKWNLGHTEVNSKTHFFGTKKTCLLKHELSVRMFGPGSVWLEFLAWVSKERNIHSLRKMERDLPPFIQEGAGPDTSGSWASQTLSLKQSHSAVILLHYCILWLPH